MHSRPTQVLQRYLLVFVSQCTALRPRSRPCRSAHRCVWLHWIQGRVLSRGPVCRLQLSVRCLCSFFFVIFPFLSVSHNTTSLRPVGGQQTSPFPSNPLAMCLQQQLSFHIWLHLLTFTTPPLPTWNCSCHIPPSASTQHSSARALCAPPNPTSCCGQVPYRASAASHPTYFSAKPFHVPYHPPTNSLPGATHLIPCPPPWAGTGWAACPGEYVTQLCL